MRAPKSMAALQKSQKLLDVRYQNLSNARNELDGSETMQKDALKDLKLAKLVIQEGRTTNSLTRTRAGFLKVMRSPIEILGLLILHAESGNTEFITTHKKIVAQKLNRSFKNKEILKQALKYLDMRAKQDISDKEIRESRQELLRIATLNMADQKADQYVLRWTDSSGNTLAHIAALAGDIESIKRLIEWQITSHPSNKNSVLHSKNNAGQTPGTVSGTTQKTPDWELELLKKLDKYLDPLETGPEFLIFYQSENRKRAKEEADHMEKFGKAFYVEPTVLADKTCDEIKKTIKPEDGETKPASCLIVAILAHGKNGQVEMKDRRMEIKDIVKQMERRQGNRPMVLLLQACQRELPERRYPKEQVDDQSSERMPEGKTVKDFRNRTQEQPDSFLMETLSWDKVPHNIPIRSVPPHEMVRSSKLVLRSTFTVGKMVSGLHKDPITGVQDLKGHGYHAISMLSQAYSFLNGCQVETRTNAEAFLEKYDLSLTSRNALDYVPRHFLCLSATVNSCSAERGLMAKMLCKKLKQMFDHQQSLDKLEAKSQSVEIDIQALFKLVKAAVDVETGYKQVSIEAQTLLKRLCLKVVGPVPQADDSDDDDEDKKGDEASGEGDNS